MSEITRVCWVVSEDKAGMLAQARGLAEAIQTQLQGHGKKLSIEIKLIERRAPWKWLPSKLWPKGVLGVRFKEPFVTGEGYPDMVISCGRQSVWPNVEIKRRSNKSGKDCFSIHIQDPKIAFKHFDMVTSPLHDKLNGENFIGTLGSLGRTSRSSLDMAAQEWTSHLEDLHKPWIAVSIGGDNKVYHYNEKEMHQMGQQLTTIAKATGGSLLVTSSRRTNPENTQILKDEIIDVPHLYWNGTGDNPYFGYLGVADFVVVTCDSINMVSEACTTGKPVYVIHTEPKRKTKFTHFHAALEEQGFTRPFEERLDQWAYKPLQETDEVAAHALKKVGWLLDK